MHSNGVVSVSVGGSVTVPRDGNIDYLKELASTLVDASSRHRLIVVVGGGWIARWYIEMARKLGQDECALDDIGIKVTRINALMLISALGTSCAPFPPANFEEAMILLASHRIIVMGGTHPGHTTDAVAVLAGERARAVRIVISTNVDGVYSSDPKKNPEAKRLSRISAEELSRITMQDATGAGSNTVIDGLGCKIIRRSRIPTMVLDGRVLSDLKGAILGENFHGTIIDPDPL